MWKKISTQRKSDLVNTGMRRMRRFGQRGPAYMTAVP